MSHCKPTPETDTVDITRRNRRNKRAGARWQATLKNELRGAGFDIEILPPNGIEDEGDLVVRIHGGSRWTIIEAKAGVMHPGSFVDQTRVETANFARHRNINPSRVTGVAVVKRRNHRWDKAYVLTSVRDHFKLNDDALYVQPSGRSWPRVLCAGLRSAGLEAELISSPLGHPEGDLVIRNQGTATVVMAKAGELRVGELLDQAEDDRLEYACERGLDPRRVDSLAIVKRRGMAWPDAYVLTTLADYFALEDQ